MNMIRTLSALLIIAFAGCTRGGSQTADDLSIEALRARAEESCIASSPASLRSKSKSSLSPFSSARRSIPCIANFTGKHANFY